MSESPATNTAPVENNDSITTSGIKKRKVLLINGPNLNLLGMREPGIYGSESLKDIETRLTMLATKNQMLLSLFQSNHEGQIIDRIHDAKIEGMDAVIINPGAFTHTSVAIRDAFAGTSLPFVEIHISNIHKRESFRQHSFLSDKAEGVICGLGTFGYNTALEYWSYRFQEKDAALSKSLPEAS